jgi:transcriptional regulator with XRE-family HTH domain
MTLSARLLKAARNLLDLSQEEVCATAGISIVTLRRLEGSGTYPAMVSDTTAAKVRAVLEARGAMFLEAADLSPGPGVAIRHRVGTE